MDGWLAVVFMRKSLRFIFIFWPVIILVRLVFVRESAFHCKIGGFGQGLTGTA